MKKFSILTLLSVLSLSGQSYGSDQGGNFILLTHDDPLWIYPTAFSSAPKRVIQQTGDINTYSFKVLDDSLFRFKVQIFEPNIDNDEYADAYSDTGWIDKINATVYLGINKHDDGRACLRLYSRPDKSSEFTDIAENDHYTKIGYVDKIAQNWYHVNVVYDGVLYSGWTDIYCTNPYGGCN